MDGVILFMNNCLSRISYYYYYYFMPSQPFGDAMKD